MAEEKVQVTRLDLKTTFPTTIPALALDIGKCMIKAAYSTPRHEVILVCADLKHADDVMQHLIQKVPDRGKHPVLAVGAGVKNMRSRLETTLDVGIQECDDKLNSAVRGFDFLQRVLPHQLLHPTCQSGIDAAQPQIKFYKAYGQVVSYSDVAHLEMGCGGSEQIPTQGTVTFPCLLVIMGSVTTILKVEQEKSFRVVDHTVGGLTFHGLAASAAGIQDFDKLLEMATVGDKGGHSSVDTYGRDLRPAGEKDDGYNMFPGDAMSLCLGKCATHPKDSLDPNDMIHGVLKALCRDIALIIHSQALINGVPRIYVAGGLADAPVVRKLMTENFAVRNFAKPPDAPYVDYQFLQHSKYLASIGALFQNQ